jgi:hypothetical protein
MARQDIKQIVKQRIGLIVTISAVAFFLWEHIGRLSDWSFRPTVGMHKAFLISKAIWTRLGEWITVAMHFAYRVLMNIYDRFTSLMQWIYENLLCHLIRYFRTFIDKIYVLFCDFCTWFVKFINFAEIVNTFGSLFSHTFDLITSPWFAIKAWIESSFDLSNEGFIAFSLIIASAICCGILIWFIRRSESQLQHKANANANANADDNTNGQRRSPRIKA